jgi:hypothetical protein
MLVTGWAEFCGANFQPHLPWSEPHLGLIEGNPVSLKTMVKSPQLLGRDPSAATWMYLVLYIRQNVSAPVEEGASVDT